MSFGEKEKKIFEGVYSLLKDGKSLYKVKVQDIADSAGVGKGTVYDYFQSKEEIIANALVNLFEKEAKEFCTIVENSTSFKNGWFSLMEYILKGVDEKCSSLQLMFTSFGLTGDEYLTYIQDGVSVSVAEITTAFIDIIKLGIKENTLVFTSDYEYGKQCVKGAIMSMVHSVRFDGTPKDVAIEISYKMILKCLS